MDDRKVRADALKLLAIIKLFKENENKDVTGIILLHYTTYRNFTSSKRYTVSYLEKLGIEIKYVTSSSAVAALSRKKTDALKEMLAYLHKKDEAILEEILRDLKDNEDSSEPLTDLEWDKRTTEGFIIAYLAK